MKDVFIFDGKEIRTMGDTMDAAIKAMREGRATEFKDAYIANLTPEHGLERAEEIVNSNLGCMSGYYNSATMAEIQKAFNTAHPVFGSMIPTAEEAFEAGCQAAKETQ